MFELIFGSNKGRLLDFYYAYPEFDYSSSTVARILKMDPAEVRRDLKQLEALGLLRMTGKTRGKPVYTVPETANAELLMKVRMIPVEALFDSAGNPIEK